MSNKSPNLVTLLASISTPSEAFTSITFNIISFKIAFSIVLGWSSRHPVFEGSLSIREQRLAPSRLVSRPTSQGESFILHGAL